MFSKKTEFSPAPRGPLFILKSSDGRCSPSPHSRSIMNVGRTSVILALLASVMTPGSAHAASTTTTTVATSAPIASALVLPAPNKGVFEGYLPALACTSAGNCVAAGTYTDGNGNQQGVLFTESAGTWQTGVAITPPTGAVSTSQGVTIYDASCGAAGSCSVIGTYLDANGNQHSFVVNQVNGAWQSGVALTLPANALTNGLQSAPRSISCATAGNCVVVGTYNTNAQSFETHGYVANEINGTWHSASELTMPSDANANPMVNESQVICWAAGNCDAVGSYIDNAGVTHAIVSQSTHFTWHTARALLLPAAASAFAGASFSEITCATPSNCVTVGSFNNAAGALEPMAASMINGVWSRAVAITLPTGAGANPATFYWGYKGVSCATPTNCAFGGDYVTSTGTHQGFLVNERNGTWQTATTLHLPVGAKYAGANGGVIAVVCQSAGVCTAAGAFVNAKGLYQTELVRETNATWGAPLVIGLPKNAPTVGVNGGVYGLHCFTSTSCQVLGSYLATGSTYEGFVVTA